MIEEKYIRENNRNYILIESKENEIDENYQVKMLKKNTISKFLPLSIRWINNKEVYYFDITSRQPISRIYEGNSVIWEDVENICISIDAVVKIVNEYMLELNSVVLDPRFVYMNISNKEICFIYYPNHDLDFFQSLRHTFEFILEHLNHSDRKTVMRVYEIYQKILQNDYDLQSIITQILQEERKDSVDEKNSNNEKNDRDIKLVDKRHMIPTVLAEEVTTEREVCNENIRKIMIAIKGAIVLIIVFLSFGIVMPNYLFFQMNLVSSIIAILILSVFYKGVNIFYCKNKMNFTKIITENELISYEITDSEIEKPKHEATPEESSSMCGTMLLSDYLENDIHSKGCRLIPNDTENVNLKIIEIKNFPFIIGSFKANNNYAIDNTLVSRIHLRILHQNNTYSIEDLNSTNGTFINEQRLNNCEPIEIHHHDIVRIASLEYHIEIN